MLDQIFKEYIQMENPLVIPTTESVKLQRKAFFMGVWVALGMFKKSTQMPENRAVHLLSILNQETKHEVYEGKRTKKPTGGLG